jgi:hypothetical protein
VYQNACQVVGPGAFISTGGKPLDLPAGGNTLKVGIARSRQPVCRADPHPAHDAALMRQSNSGSRPPQLPFLDVCNGEKRVTGFASAAEKSVFRRCEFPAALSTATSVVCRLLRHLLQANHYVMSPETALIILLVNVSARLVSSIATLQR